MTKSWIRIRMDIACAAFGLAAMLASGPALGQATLEYSGRVKAGSKQAEEIKRVLTGGHLPEIDFEGPAKPAPAAPPPPPPEPERRVDEVSDDFQYLPPEQTYSPD